MSAQAVKRSFALASSWSAPTSSPRMKHLRITFERLDRFEGSVSVDLSGPLTAIVGPNGSGKSTILEAVAEVLTFLQNYLISGPADKVREGIRTHRPTSPSWTKAVVECELVVGKAVAIGASLAPHFSKIPSRVARVSVCKHALHPDTWTLASIGIGDHDLDFNIAGPLIVDSRRKHEAELQIQQVADALDVAHKANLEKVTQATRQLENFRNANRSNQSAAVHQKLVELQATIDTLNAEHEEYRKRAKDQRVALENVVAAARGAAVDIGEGDEVEKADVEDFCESLALPRVLYLQGLPDFTALVEAMTTRLGALKDHRRSGEQNSDYNRMRERLEQLLKMDVTIERSDTHTLLVDDRPVAEVSSGTWCALGFAALCEQETPDALVIWDEPETGLHPTWARKICDLMVKDTRRFLIATHRTEFVPVMTPGVNAYKSAASPPERGQKVLCTLRTETAALASGLAIAVALGLEPSRVLFTTNAVLWVEGPSDVVYWRFWLAHAAKKRGVALVEGFDYAFMFSAGSLLGNETLAEDMAELPSDAVNLLSLVGASRVIVDTDFNPDDSKTRATRDAIGRLSASPLSLKDGFVFQECRPYLRPRVRALAAAIDRLVERGNQSTIASTWGREAENALSDQAFQRTLRRIYNSSDAAVNTHLDALVVDPWVSYESAILDHLQIALSRPELRSITVLRDGEPTLAQMSVIRDKIQFARHYVEAHGDLGSNLRPEAEGLVGTTLDWILKIRADYLQ